MNNVFLFLDYNKREIEGNDFICINVLEFNKHQVFNIYKKYSKELLEKLNSFKSFQNINDYITFAIKSKGKITLDIKL